MDESVQALTIYNGDLIAGGDFTTAGGQGANFIARWDGASWLPVGTGMDASVSALTVFNGELVAGGEFITAGGVSANFIARWDGSTWHPLGSGMNHRVSALAVFNEDLIVGGGFNIAGGVQARRIARWDGSAWHPLGSGMNGAESFSVEALAVFNAELVAGGHFTTVDGQIYAQRLARWNGTSWRPLGTLPLRVSLAGVHALTVCDGALIAAGSGFPIVRWDGSAWQALGIGVDGSVSALSVFRGELVAGGSFATAGGNVSAHVARWGSGFPFADWDCDDAVDLADFVQEHSCLGGPDEPYAAGCVRGDHDGDQDLDLADLQYFLNGYKPGE